MKYFFINTDGEEIELKIDSEDADSITFVEVEDDEVSISSNKFVSMVLNELSESDASPYDAVPIVIAYLDKKYGKWFLESDIFEQKDVEHFKEYCNEQCGTSLTYEEALLILSA